MRTIELNAVQELVVVEEGVTRAHRHNARRVRLGLLDEEPTSRRRCLGRGRVPRLQLDHHGDTGEGVPVGSHLAALVSAVAPSEGGARDALRAIELLPDEGGDARLEPRQQERARRVEPRRVTGRFSYGWRTCAEEVGLVSRLVVRRVGGG